MGKHQEQTTHSKPVAQRLQEAYERLWDSFVDPLEALLDDEYGGFWLPVEGAGSATTIGSGSTPGGLNETQQRAIRQECRQLAAANEFAINGHENRISYIVGEGHLYRVTARTKAAEASGLAITVQEVLDEFFSRNRWSSRQQEIVRRKDRDGEAIIRLFTRPTGEVDLRFVEPAQVIAPPGREATASHGIETDPDDVETVKAYWIDGERVPANEIQHRKAGVDCNVKRGLPLFYAVRKNLRRAEKILRNMSVVAEIQSAIALIRKHQGSRSGVQNFLAQQTEPRPGGVEGTGRGTRRYPPGTILDSYGGIDYDFPAAAIDASSFVKVLQAELRAIASRLVMPEFMLTSDASNANYASTMVAEGPAVKMFRRLQAELMAEDQELLRRVIAVAISAGRLPPEASSEVQVHITPPVLTVRNELEDVQAYRTEYECGVLSRQTWCERRGLDYEHEQRNLSLASKAGAPGGR